MRITWNTKILLIIFNLFVASLAHAQQTFVWKLNANTESNLECANSSQAAIALNITIFSADGAKLNETKQILAPTSTIELKLSTIWKQDGEGSIEINAQGTGEPACQITLASRIENTPLSNLPRLETPSSSSWIALPDSLLAKVAEANLILVNPGSNSSVKSIIVGYDNQGTKVSEVEVELPSHGLKSSPIEISKVSFVEILAVKNEKVSAFAELRSNGVEQRAFIFAQLPQLDTGPISLSSFSASTNEIIIGNTGISSQEYKVELRSNGGILLEEHQLTLLPHTRKKVPITYNKLPKAASVRVRSLTAENDSSVTQVFSYQDKTEGLQWWYSHGPVPPVETNQIAVNIINTHPNILSQQRFLEWNSIITECLVKVYSSTGDPDSENSFLLNPDCAKKLQIGKQTGKEFLGMSVAETQVAGAKYSSESIRLVLSPEKHLLSVFYSPAIRLAVADQKIVELPKDPEKIACGQTQHDTQEVFLDEISRKQIEDEIKVLSQKAETLINTDAEEALRLFQQAVDRYPKFICGREKIIFLLLARLNRLKEANHAAEDLLLVDSKNERALLTLAYIANQNGHFEKVEPLINQARENDPTSPIPLQQWGAILTLQGRANEAIKVLQQAQALASDYPPSFVGEAVVKSFNGQIADTQRLVDAFEKSMTEFRTTAKYEGYVDRGDNYLDMAIVAVRLNSFNKADEFYSMGQDLSHNKGKIAKVGGLIYMQKGDFNKATELLLKGLALMPNNAEIENDLGWAMQNLGRNQEAEEYYLTSIKHNPKDTQVHINYGLLLGNTKNLDGAEIEFKKVIELSSTHGWGYNNLGWILEMKGDLNAALDQYLTAWKYIANEPLLIANICRVSQNLGRPVSLPVSCENNLVAQ